MDPEYKKREKIRSEFVKRFLPRGLRSGHGLLFDFQKPCDFRPDANQLKECVGGYLTLLRNVPSNASGEIRGGRMLDASELVLAYLGRSNEKNRIQLPDNIVKEVLLIIDALLSDIQKKSEADGIRYLNLDGCKRIWDIARLLSVGE
jgi:hypothetical protein